MKKRCAFEGCKKRIHLTDWACKCGKYYCSSHKDLFIHQCSSFHEERVKQQEQLKEKLVDAKFTKMVKI